MAILPFQNPSDPESDAFAEIAASWLARRDRGLSPAEQDQYLQWLRADPRHAEAVARHAAAFERMMRLYEWQPSNDIAANPDLFKPSRPASALRWARAHRFWSTSLAAAAAVAVVLFWVRPDSGPAPSLKTAPRSFLHVNERLALPDGSRIELKDGARVVVLYSESERRVKLANGEAHFTVWKDRTRPFIVEVANVEVRAVGTAFNVRLDDASVEVLVTEGRVSVAGEPGPGVAKPGERTEPLLVSNSERAVVSRDRAEAPLVAPVTSEEIRRELDWQAPRLQFAETPLADAVAAFNRLNRHQIHIADPELGRRLIGGTYRPDNVEGFVRMLGATLDLTVENMADGRTLLKRAR